MDGLYSLPGIHDPFSSITHLVGAGVFAALSVFLLRSTWGDRKRFWTTAIFAFSAVVLLTLSGIYHMFAPGGITRQVLLRLDVAAIFLLIAGTFTPVHGVLFRGWKRWGVLAVIWTIAVVGITVRIIFFDNITSATGAMAFLAMGWIGAISGYLMWKSHGFEVLIPIVAGGLIYTFGAIINVTNWPTVIPHVWGPHETFHLAVLGGLGFHWWVISQVVAGSFPAAPPHPVMARD